MKFKKHKKLIIKSLLLFGICFSLGFIYNYHLPKIESLILINVEKKSSEFLPVRVWPKKAQLSFFPLGIDLQDIHLIPQKELGFKLAPFNVNSASVHISLFKLLLGRVVISNVTVDGFSLSFKNLKNPISKKTKPSANAKKNSAPLFSFDFNILKKIPIESISIKNFKVDGSIENDGYTFDTRRINFTIKKLLKSIYVDLNVAGIKLKEKKSLPTLAFDFSTKFLLNKNVIKFNSLKLFKKISTSWLQDH